MDIKKDVVLGLEFMQKHQVKLDTANLKLSIGTAKVKVILAERKTIPIFLTPTLEIVPDSLNQQQIPNDVTPDIPKSKTHSTSSQPEKAEKEIQVESVPNSEDGKKAIIVELASTTNTIESMKKEMESLREQLEESEASRRMQKKEIAEMRAQEEQLATESQRLDKSRKKFQEKLEDSTLTINKKKLLTSTSGKLWINIPTYIMHLILLGTIIHSCLGGKEICPPI